MLRMTGDRVLLKRELPQEKRGLIHIPKIAQKVPLEAEVIAVGPLVKTLKVGDHVLFGRWSVLEVEQGWIAYEKDIMGVIE